MKNTPEYRLLRNLRDPNGEDRLRLRLIRVPDAENAWNSDAIIWETRANDEWTESVVFSRDELQGDFPRRRWAADIDKFDAVNGFAIIKVGEESEPTLSGRVMAIYSWWICDIRKKRLIELIRLCEDPDEKYDST